MVRRAVRAGVPVLAVAAVVAVAATGAGLLVPGVDLSGSTRQMLRIGGLVVAALGLAALVVDRKRRPARPGQSDPMTVALMAAAAIMAALALLSLPFSPGLTIGSNDQTDSDDGLTGSDRGSGSTTDLDGTTAAGTGAGDSNGSAVAIDDNTRFTVAVDRATGETTPIAIDPDSGRAFAFDPQTGETTPLSFDPSGSQNGDSGLLVPVGVDRTTGEVGIVGIVDRETGEVGIIGGTDSGVDLGELDPATLDGLVEVAGGDLENFASREPRAGAFGTRNLGVIGSIDPGRQPDGQIDFSAFDFSDVQIGGPTGGDPENLDWNRIGRELDQAEIDDAGAGDARIDDTAPGDAAPDATDGGSDTANRINDRRSFDGRNLGIIVQAALRCWR